MPDRQRVLDALRAANIQGVEHFGTFINDTEYLSPSRFDAVAALPYLIDLLPTIDDPRVAETIGRYLAQRPKHPEAYHAALTGYRKWAPTDWTVGWVFGDSLARLATRENSIEMRELSGDASLGNARQMIVFSLWRFKSSDPEIVPLLGTLVYDPTVGLHAMSALQRSLGKDAVLSTLDEVADKNPGTPLGAAATKKARSIRRQLNQRPR